MKKGLALLLCLCVSLGLTGCFSLSADELLALPKQPQESVQLQKQIDKQLAQNAQLISPISGVNRQAVQKVDIDGDGEEDTAIFYRVVGDKPLCAIFYHKGNGYEQMARIDGEGESVNSFAYADLDRDGGNEILIVWRVGQGALKALTVHTFRAGKMELLLSVACNGYALQDMDGDGRTELVVLRQDAAVTAEKPDAPSGVAEMYAYDGAGMPLLSQAPLSKNISSLIRLKSGQLSSGQPAVFVASQYDVNAVVTDICAVRGGTLSNITLDAETGVSQGLVRQYTTPVATDIDGDGVLEVPEPIALPPYSLNDEGTVWLVQWRAYDIWGNSRVIKTTFHNYTDKWYFEVPDNWVAGMSQLSRDTFNGLTMRRYNVSTGEKNFVFAVPRTLEDVPLDLLVISTLTGDNREELAREEGRVTVLSRQDMIVTAVKRSGAVGLFAIDEADLPAKSFWIQDEWITGELNLG
ncbi:MAG: hypothetical protein LBT60_05350 [Oscillospiraceae bacterium]|jgi:hypothetical protein|nr:hypothetical protein [Oscillospiraceae bacterium]